MKFIVTCSLGILIYFVSGKVLAEEPRFYITLDEKSKESYCLYNNGVYSEGAVYKTSSGESFVCALEIDGATKARRVVWREKKK